MKKFFQNALSLAVCGFVSTSCMAADIVDTAVAAGNFKTLATALGAADLVETLKSDGPFTVFAPTDEAFAKLPAGTVESLLKPENKQKLVNILKYHVVSGRVYSEDAVNAKSAATLEGSPISISIGSKGAMINKAQLVATDIDASNGVIHIIDSVLMPPAKGADARQMLEQTIAQGAALYNAGHHAACANLYQDTMSQMMSLPLDSTVKSRLTSVIQAAQTQHCDTTRAWTLRNGMDQMYAQLSSH